MKIVEFKDYDNQTTPLSAYNLNRLQQNLITTKYQMTFSSAVSGGSTITLPCYYQVGQDTLDVYLNSELLKKASTKDSEGHYYEVGNSDTKSNQIKITSDWSIASGDVLNLIVRGTTDSYDQNLSPDKATQLADEISANKEEITALQTENSRLKGITNALPKVSEEGTSLTLENTANTPFNNIILKGNTTQDGTPTPDNPVDINVVTGEQKITISSGESKQEYPLSLGDKELCKIGNVSDELVIENGKAKIIKNIGKIIVDGVNYKASAVLVINSLSRIRVLDNFTEWDKGKLIQNMIFTRFIFSVSWDTSTAYGKYDSNGNLMVQFSFVDDSIKNITAANNWLKNNPVTIYYQLSTPVEEQITDTTLIAQLNALERATSYDDTTNISQTNANLPFIINAEAFKKIS